ncbi:hypothetical protein GUJ93_ZPchr0006g42439 [Zizania palustris]|uniref:Uncharacterized protein n=2 Tax=Zizania palustris TaxID=103762 RepID=A0A8J5SZG5_ZIZPA|nr:hypothetical protein GUJ93_ZPchr0006g42439 [Zizania palustris]KAG8074092.1 hypothetical protein GUJ93_ZPchr0006g42439 [Zizania palustris]
MEKLHLYLHSSSNSCDLGFLFVHFHAVQKSCPCSYNIYCLQLLQDALRHVFTSRIMDIKDSPVWGRLSYVSCASNGLVLMDESLQLLPAVETLDLSRNQFAKVDNLRKCTKLRTLDLGFNHLRSISSLSEACSRIVKLVLRNNALTAVHGIENLKSLTGLDLSYNIISIFSELEILGSLSLLQNLWLEGNPICCARWYRAHVFSFFHNSESLKLDDKGMNTQEYWEKQVMFSSRQKQPAGYVFFFPAKDDHENEDISNSKMKKISRLALIVEDDTSLCDEGVDQLSTPHESDSSKKEEVAAADNDIKITSLINTAELMKKEKSTDWLREFKEWMDENMENTEVDNLYIDFSNSNGRNEKQKRRQNSQRKNSKNISDLVQASEGGSSSNLLESDLYFTDDACNGANCATTESSNEVNTYQAPLGLHLTSSQQLPPLKFVDALHSDSCCEMEDGTGNLHANGISPNVMNKLMKPNPSFANSSPQSPPQYKEDILHRRLCLEEEFLQTSGDFNCAASLGSDSSCSDDSSGDVCSCNSEDDCVAIQTKMDLALNGQIVLFSSVDYDHEEMDGIHLFSGQKSLHNYSEEDDPYFADSIEFGKGLHDRYERNGHLGQVSDHLVRQKGNHKFKRIPPIFKNHNGTKVLFLKDNRNEVDEGASIGGNGHLRCNLNNGALCKEHSSEKHSSSILHKDNLCTNANTVSHNTENYKLIGDFFNVEIASDGSEICEKTAFCGYIFQDETGSDLVQREVALLQSSQNKLHILLVDMARDGRDTTLRVLGSYCLEDVQSILIGLGLQALRVHMADNTTHLFLTRTSKEAQDVLCLLNASNFPRLTTGVSLQRFDLFNLLFSLTLIAKHYSFYKNKIFCVYCGFYFI